MWRHKTCPEAYLFKHWVSFFSAEDSLLLERKSWVSFLRIRFQSSCMHHNLVSRCTPDHKVVAPSSVAVIITLSLQKPCHMVHLISNTLPRSSVSRPLHTSRSSNLRHFPRGSKTEVSGYRLEHLILPFQGASYCWSYWHRLRNNIGQRVNNWRSIVCCVLAWRRVYRGCHCPHPHALSKSSHRFNTRNSQL